jgi:hypothetical protein
MSDYTVSPVYFLQCQICREMMIGITSYRTRIAHTHCGGEALNASEPMKSWERDDIYAYHQRIRHLYDKKSRRT